MWLVRSSYLASIAMQTEVANSQLSTFVTTGASLQTGKKDAYCFLTDTSMDISGLLLCILTQLSAMEPGWEFFCSCLCLMASLDPTSHNDIDVDYSDDNNNWSNHL